MTAEELKALNDKLTTVSDAVKRHAEKAEKSHGDLSASVKAQVDELLATQNAIKSQIGAAEQELVKIRDKQTAGEPIIVKSIGAQVRAAIEASAELKTFMNGPRSGQTFTIAVKTANFESDLPSRVIQPERIAPLPRLRRALFIRDLIAAGRTGSNAVEYVRTTGFTNAAEPVTEGASKPRSTLTYDLQTTTVKTLAHIYKASKQILQDLPQLASDIDNELRYGLKAVEESQILTGSGTGSNLHGIIPQASAYSGAFSPASETNIDVLRLAILQAELALLPATGVVLHATDWAKIELTKTSFGEYIFANPASGLAAPGLWGLPVVATPGGIATGHFLVGGFDSAAQVLDREDMNVVIATQNEDDFVKNMITIRCEERLALVVKRPEAFIYGAFL